MALAKKCDRCGKFYDYYPIGDKVQYNALRMIQKKITGETKNSHAAYDLCSDCMYAFAKFITEKKINYEKEQDNG